MGTSSEAAVIKVGEVAPPVESPTKFEVGGQTVDLGPLMGAYADVSKAMQLAARNPLGFEPMRLIANAQKVLVGVAKQPLPRQVAHIVSPFARSLGPMVEAAREAVRLRLHAGHRLMQQPTITVPITLAIPANGTAPAAGSTIDIQSPYLGSGGTCTTSRPSGRSRRLSPGP